MKKLTAIVLTALMLLGLLTGCGGKSADTPATGAPATGAPATSAPAVDPTPEPQPEVHNDFSAEAQSYLEYIGAELPQRNALLPGEEPDEDNHHQETFDWILAELKKAGYTDDQIDCTAGEAEAIWVPGGVALYQNIVLTVEGKQPDKQVIIGAHYDGDGVGDNGSGLALLLSTAVGLAGQTPLYTVKYAFFDAEEVGLVGAKAYAASLTEEEAAKTVYMVNIDAIAFGDYCNLYGGLQDDDGNVTQTEAYDLAMAKAAALGFQTFGTAELDGYFAAHGQGPAPQPGAVYTNPWTLENPAPMNDDYVSPSTGDWSDHADFKYMGIPYVYLEATNWYAAGDGGEDAYTGYFETADASLGFDGMFMNTEFDTLENLNTLFPGRSLEHFQVFSPLLCSLAMNPASAAALPQ